MKKYLCALVLLLCVGFSSKASPGDTTWVQANNVQLSTYNHNYDTAVTFPAPGTTYRKIYMIFTLGKYMCPAGSTYCGDWDYTIQNYLMTASGDTLELGRLITPYANAGAPRTPWSWTQRYIYDVTDYVSLLQNAATMRLFFSGWSGGFSANVKFAFIEGTPERNVLGVQKVYGGSYSYGDTVGGDINDINTHFPAVAATAPAGTHSTDLKFTVTGHGSDSVNNCCEFASHNYQVELNGSPVATQTIWRDNCGANELYPQSGTWLLQRANWCPGAMVYSNIHTLPGVAAGQSFSVSVVFDPYSEPPATGSGYGSYTTFGTLIYHGAMNHAVDVSLEDVISPTNNENYFRENPVAGYPMVHVRNTGSTTVTSISFAYYADADSTTPTLYTWMGTLPSMQDSDLRLPELYSLRAIAGVSGTHTFTAKIAQVNGAADEDNTNNIIKSTFVAAPLWPVNFVVQMETNNEADNSGNCETSWQITDMYGNIVAQRKGALNTLYRDTVTLGPAPYKLQVFDTFNCDGLNWFEFPYYTPPVTSGYLKVVKYSGLTIPMNGYNYSGQYNNDFGCGFTQYFTTAWPASVSNVSGMAQATLTAFPNPAQAEVSVDIAGFTNVAGTIQVLDALGRVVLTTSCDNVHQQINVGRLSNGAYTLLYFNDADNSRLQTKMIIAK